MAKLVTVPTRVAMMFSTVAFSVVRGIGTFLAHWIRTDDGSAKFTTPGSW